MSLDRATTPRPPVRTHRASTTSPGGSSIYRHGNLAAPSLRVDHADDSRISEHLQRVHGGRAFVLHEIISDRVHLDVHVQRPTDEHPFYLVATSGMSARPMTMPAGMEDAASWQYAELCMLLPPTWTPGQEQFKDERVYWPIRLKTLARIPHDFDSWLGWGHSIPNGDPAKPYFPGTALCGAVIVPPFLLGKGLFVVPGEPPMHMFQVLPVTAKEMQLKPELGSTRCSRSSRSRSPASSARRLTPDLLRPVGLGPVASPPLGALTMALSSEAHSHSTPQTSS